MTLSKLWQRRPHFGRFSPTYCRLTSVIYLSMKEAKTERLLQSISRNGKSAAWPNGLQGIAIHANVNTSGETLSFNG